MALRTLKVTNYAENEADNKEVTIAPAVIKAVIADAVAHVRQSKSVKNVAILLMEGDSIELTISEYDLHTLEEVVGGYEWD